MTGVYLASAIDQADPTQGKMLTEARIHRWLAERASWVFDPAKAFRTRPDAPRDPAIREINRDALSRAGLLIALMPKGTVSIGVPMEIERAVAAGTPTLVISDAPSWMLEFDRSREPHARVFTEWGPEAKAWAASILSPGGPPDPSEGVSEHLGGFGRARMPVVVSEGAEAPRRGYPDDAGLDLVVSEDTLVEPGQFVDIPCGVSVQLPDWSWGLIIGRSSTLRKRKLMVNQGVIDAGYRGPLFAGVWNLNRENSVLVHKGERIAQLLILPNGTRSVEVIEVDELGPGSRGTNGFGSSGT